MTSPDNIIPNKGSPGSQSSPSPTSSGQAGGLPELTIVAGQPTAQETAAVVVVLSALAGEPGPAPAARPAWSEWAARSRFLRPPLTPGPGAWRASALPR